MKFYEISRHISTDERAINKLIFIKRLNQKSKEEDCSDIKDKFTKIYRGQYKKFCNDWRRSLEIDNYLSVIINKDNTEIIIIIFDLKADQENFYKPNFEEGKGHYIEV